MKRLAVLQKIHAEIASCSSCTKMIGPSVHGPPVLSKVFLLGQAPGPREAKFGRPFAWTAGKTLFKWFEGSCGIDEARFRERIYMAAAARCFPGKASGGGDRRPDAEEIATCGRFLAREVEVIQPELVLAVGTLAISVVLGPVAAKQKLDALVGDVIGTLWHGQMVDVICLPHPSGASPWHKLEPGKTLLSRALSTAKKHPAMRDVLRP